MARARTAGQWFDTRVGRPCGLYEDLDSAEVECVAPERIRAALLAVGDVGRPAGYTRLFDTQLSVSAALDFEHRERRSEQDPAARNPARYQQMGLKALRQMARTAGLDRRGVT